MFHDSTPHIFHGFLTTRFSAEPLDGLRMCHVRRLHGVAAVEGALIGHGFPRVEGILR